MRLKRDTKDVIESTILLILGCAEQSAVIFAFLLHGVSVPLLFGEQCAVLVLLVGLTGLRKNMSQIEICEKGVQVRDPVRTAFFSYAEVKTLVCVTYWNRKPAKDYLVISRHSIDRPEIEMISHSYVASVLSRSYHAALSETSKRKLLYSECPALQKVLYCNSPKYKGPHRRTFLLDGGFLVTALLLYLWNTLLAVGAVSAMVSQVLCCALDAAFLLFWWKQLRRFFGKKHAPSE